MQKKKAPNDHEMIIAALLHDIGHLLVLKDQGSIPTFGAENHEKIGAEYLSSLGFSDRITKVIEGHVLAKRYLCYKNPDYLKKLSDGSYGSLKTQGWCMDKTEADFFETNPLFQDILYLRSFEDLAKNPSLTTTDFESYKGLITEHLEEKLRTERDSNP